MSNELCFETGIICRFYIIPYLMEYQAELIIFISQRIIMSVDQEKIFDIEKRIAELKFSERDLNRERDILRLKSLGLAEKSIIVDDVIRKFFLNSLKAERKELIVNSFPSKFSGRNEEEFMSEVKVEIRFKPAAEKSEYSELSLYVYLKSGFQDSDVQTMEKQIMDRLVEIRKDVNELKESKKMLKQNN